jgi:DNA-binding MarR family transcriptional regulator
MQLITEILRQISASLGYTGKEISKILHILAEFAKNASPEYFVEHYKQKKAFKEIPLFFTEKGEATLKEKLSEFPRVLSVGKADYKKSPLNFLYLVGQFLSVVATRLDYLEVTHKDVYEKQKEEIESLFKIWDSREHMNALSLFNKAQSVDNKTALKELEKKLSASAQIMDKLDIDKD